MVDHGLWGLLFVLFVFVMFWCHWNYMLRSIGYECQDCIVVYGFLCCDWILHDVDGHGPC